MLTALFILTGISLAARVVAFYYDQKTEAEAEREERLLELHRQFSAAEGQKREALRQRLVNVYLTDVEEQRGLFREVASNLEHAADRLERHLGSETTPLRSAALRVLLRGLRSKTQKAFANVEYLDWLEARIRRIAVGGGAPEEVPSLSLPADFPFVGHIVELPSGAKDGRVRLAYGFAQLDDPGPGAVEGASAFVREHGRGSETTLSLARAVLQSQFLEEPGVSFDARVERVERHGAILDFLGVKLWLESRERIDPTAPIVRGARLQVYPVDWRFDLGWLDRRKTHVVRVSERREASLRESAFSDIGLVVPDELGASFHERFGQLTESTQPWLIQPHEDEGGQDEPKRLLFQQGDDAFVARVQRDGSRPRFVLERIIRAGARGLDPAGLYASFEVPLVVVLESELETLLNGDEWGRHFAELDVFLCEEFRVQRRLKAGQAGAVYFRRWGKLLGRLIRHKVRLDDGVELGAGGRLLSERNRRWSIRVNGARTAVLQEYLDRHAADEHESFVIATEREVIGPVWRDAKEAGLFELRAFAGQERLLQHGSAALRLHAAGFPSPEIQQRRAIEALRRGDVVNPSIRQALLTPGETKPNPDGGRTLIEPSPLIASDPVQRQVVERLNAERDLACLQGPPGAGKTTVIIELIQQQLRREPHARILVVSQSNVAVDNVLLGLHEKVGKGRLLRIGHRDKMHPDVLALGVDIERRHLDYVEHRRRASIPEALRPLHDSWLQQLGANVSPDVAELLIAQHQVVGATCVGLANRRVELDRREFDLVVIDEAARATPGELLLPLLRAHKAILVGDQNQLPPTIDESLRDEDCEVGVALPDVRAMYAETLFERLFNGLERAGGAHRLATQYRMPAPISRVISRMFYGGALGCGWKPREPRPVLMAHPLTWLDTSEMPSFHSTPDENNSQKNLGEVDLVTELLAILVHLARRRQSTGLKVAVITSYAAQKRELDEALGSSSFVGAPVSIAVNTVDAFQGKEADLVIFCTTRSRGSVAFINDRHRLNVALSRARMECVVIGARDFLTAAPTTGAENLFAHLATEMQQEGASFLRVKLGGADELAPVLAREARDVARPVELVKKERSGAAQLAFKSAAARGLLAVVDVGTTSTKVLVSDRGRFLREGFSWSLMKQFPEVSRGGLNDVNVAVGRDGLIDLGRLDRAVRLQKNVARNLWSIGVQPEDTIAIATGAIRGAPNRAEVLDHLSRAGGVPLEVLSGRDEARWSLLSCCLSSLTLPGELIVSIDHGGGSTEVSMGRWTKEGLDLVSSVSMPIGTSGLCNFALNEDERITVGEACHAVRRHVEALVAREAINAPDVSATVIGMGSSLLKAWKGKTAEEVHGLEVDPARLRARLDRVLTRDDLAGKPFAELVAFGRADDGARSATAANQIAIVMGVPVFEVLLQRLGSRRLKVSGATLRHGIFFAGALGLLQPWAPQRSGPSIRSSQRHRRG